MRLFPRPTIPAAALLFAACTPPPAPPAAAPPAQPLDVRPWVPERPASLVGDTLTITGAVTRADGSPAAGADVWVGVGRAPAEGEPRTPGDECRRPPLLYARATADASGRFRRAVEVPPAARAGGCLAVLASAGEGAARAHGARFTPVAAAAAEGGARRVDVRLEAPRAAGGGERVPRRPDFVWDDVARGPVPGWAGFVLESCTIVASLTDPERHGEAARAYLRAQTAGRPFGGCPPGELPIRLRKVEYDWDQLSRWYGLAQQVLAVEGVTMSDMDEGQNRLVFGYESEEALERARRTLAETGIPPGAVVLEVAAPVCTMEARSSLVVAVTDARTGRRPRGDGAVTAALPDTTFALEGPYPAEVPGAPDAAVFSGPFERAGTFRVEVRFPGYRPWVREGVVVPEDRCHVQTRHVDAALEPAE